MLFEKSIYSDDFPLNIRIGKITEYPFHYHKDVEFVYVLKGEIMLKNLCHNYHLKEGNIFTHSGNEVHAMSAITDDNIIAIIQVSNRFFTQYFPTLNRACYMTYIRNAKNPKLDPLKKMLLNILLDYSKRSFNYKTTCTDQIVDAITYINQHYNLFAFEGQLVVNFKNENPIIIERISRIISYVYANHSSKITLEELAEQEHLSTFYISHIIKDYMGINFQEFLCFARVEMSERLLLDTNRKISTIAKDVGFSTTAYYNKFFIKWFGHTPLKHRQMYSSKVLSSDRPVKLDLLSDNQALNHIRKYLSALQDQGISKSIVNNIYSTVNCTPNDKVIKKINPSIEVVITNEDYSVMKGNLFSTLQTLNASRIILLLNEKDPQEATNSLLEKLHILNYEVSISNDSNISLDYSAGHDSIAFPIHVFRNFLGSSDDKLQCKLRDQGNPEQILKGSPSSLTSSLIAKPSFHGFHLMKNIQGDLIYRDDYSYIIKNNSTSKDSYTFVTINHNPSIQHLYSRPTTVSEANDILNSYKDVLNLSFSMPVTPGEYAIAKYELSNSPSIFHHMANLDFPDSFPLPKPWVQMLNTMPQSQVNIESVGSSLNINSTIKGAGINIIVVEKVIA